MTGEAWYQEQCQLQSLGRQLCQLHRLAPLFPERKMQYAIHSTCLKTLRRRLHDAGALKPYASNLQTQNGIFCIFTGPQGS